MGSPQVAVKVEGNSVAKFVLAYHVVGALEIVSAGEGDDDEDSEVEAWSLSAAITSSLCL